MNEFEMCCYAAAEIKLESLIIEAKETEKRFEYLHEALKQFDQKRQELVMEKEKLADKLSLLNKNIKDIKHFAKKNDWQIRMGVDNERIGQGSFRTVGKDKSLGFGIRKREMDWGRK